MKTSVRVLALMAVGLMLLSAAGCDKLRARDQLNKGVGSYKSGKFEEAINHFQQAVYARSRIGERPLVFGDGPGESVYSRRRR